MTIRVSALDWDDTNEGMIGTAMSLGSQGFLYIVGSTSECYIVSNHKIEVTSRDMENIASKVRHSEEDTIVLDSGIEVWVIV